MESTEYEQSEVAVAQPAVDMADDVQDSEEPEVAFTWQASEYVHHTKTPMWYGMLGLCVVVLIGVAIGVNILLETGSFSLWLTIAVFLGGFGAVVVYARKPPRTMLYELSDQGVQIDGKLFPFSSFRSFGVIPDEDWHSIDLEPVKRLNPRMVLLFDSSNFEEIVGHLERHLPRADRELDLIERITRYVRF